MSGGMITDKWIRKNYEGNYKGLMEVLYWNFRGGTKENHEIRIAGVLAEIRT